jgi:hypothetical protein
MNVEALEQLVVMRERGLITEEEFQGKRAEILSRVGVSGTAPRIGPTNDLLPVGRPDHPRGIPHEAGRDSRASRCANCGGYKVYDEAAGGAAQRYAFGCGVLVIVLAVLAALGASFAPMATNPLSFVIFGAIGVVLIIVSPRLPSPDTTKRCAICGYRF